MPTSSTPSWLCELSREPVSEADCLACARQRLEPDCPFNPALLKALALSLIHI